MKLLVFPVDMQECEDYINVCDSIGIEVVKASSEMVEKDVIKLPYINDSNFKEVLKCLINEKKITHIYTPHQAVWKFLNKINIEINCNYVVCGEEPFTAVKKRFEKNINWANKIYKNEESIKIIANNKCLPKLSISAYSELHRNFLNIPGQTDEKKLEALCDIFRTLPCGDILEIGSLYGRSAYALGYLSNKHSIGNLICIDPWRNHEKQGNAAELLNEDQEFIDYESIFDIFKSIVNSLENIAYIRKTSTEALAYYERALESGELVSDGLKPIKLADKISLLHIDGNHSYENVKKDVEIWSKFIKPNGWLLLDDYIWSFGDGPRILGDQLVASGKFKNTFVRSDTLFLQIK
jgi:hypothetical protein